MITLEKLSITFIPEKGDYFGEIVITIGGMTFSILTAVETVQEMLHHLDSLMAPAGTAPEEPAEPDFEEYDRDPNAFEEEEDPVQSAVDQLQERMAKEVAEVRHGIAIEEARDPDGNLLSDGYGIPPLGLHKP